MGSLLMKAIRVESAESGKIVEVDLHGGVGPQGITFKGLVRALEHKFPDEWGHESQLKLKAVGEVLVAKQPPFNTYAIHTFWWPLNIIKYKCRQGHHVPDDHTFAIVSNTTDDITTTQF